MARTFDCPHCGVTTAIDEGVYLDSDDCDSCGRNYWETPLVEEEEEMTEADLDGLKHEAAMNETAERLKEYDQLNGREIQVLTLDFMQTMATEMKLFNSTMELLLDATLSQSNDHQLATFQKQLIARQAMHTLDNLPTAEEPNHYEKEE